MLAFVPALRALRRDLPDQAHISIMVSRGRGGEAILERCPYISELMVYDYKSSVIEQIRLIRKLRKERFDVAIASYPTGRKSAWFIWAIGASHRIGFPVDGGDFLFDEYIAKDIGLKHFTECNLELLKPLGIETDDSSLKIWLKNDDERFALSFLKSEGIKKEDLLITIHPGSGGPHELLGRSKIWPEAKFASLCDRLIENCDAKVCIVGGSRELEAVEKIAAQMENEPVIAVNKSSITQTAAIIKRADLHIGNDSGPMHIAVAVGTPVIALFGPTDPKVVGPRGEDDIIIKKEISCSPCWNHFGARKLDCDRPICIEAIEVEDVIEGVKHQMSSI